MKYTKLFQSHSDYNTYISSNDKLLPNVSYCVNENEVHFNPWTYAETYFTFTALEDLTYKFMRNSLQYSTDNGSTWETLPANSSTPTITQGTNVLWKAENPTINTFYPQGIGTFISSGNFEVKGNVMSLIYGDNFKNQTDLTGKQYCFSNLLANNNQLINAEKLSLPATTLADYCYKSMFYSCTSLTTTPSILPATILADQCYYQMFYGCTSLTTAPAELPATTLTDDCYNGMFNGCTSLTTAPELPATTLAIYCYRSMFSGCTSLVNAPALPATTLASNCYYNMFNYCTSLVNAPELPATTLTDDCYYGMFNGCTSLNYIKAMFTTTPSSTYTSNWVSNVAASGTFVKNSAAEWDVTGVNGVPTKWTVQTASE